MLVLSFICAAYYCVQYGGILWALFAWHLNVKGQKTRAFKSLRTFDKKKTRTPCITVAGNGRQACLFSWRSRRRCYAFH